MASRATGVDHVVKSIRLEFPQMRSRAHTSLSRLAAAGIAVLLAFAGVAPVAGWANGPSGGNGYGTHDWILDQALRYLAAEGVSTSWVDREIALLATDDPDKIEVAQDPDRDIEHVYTGGGRRGGAIHRITEHYAAMLREYGSGDFDGASYQLGMLAHFYGDILVPYHTSRDAIGQTTKHHAYELLVDDSHRTPTSGSGWSIVGTSWALKDVTNIRTTALAAAAYSRVRYTDLAANFDANDTTLSPVANTITREVLRRASGDLADIIQSVPKGIGNPPAVGSLTVTLRWRGVKTNEASQRLDGKALDVNGKPIEGLLVNVKWPMPDGSIKTMPFWTDELGNGHIYGVVGSNPYMVKQNVTVTATTNQTTVTKNTWWYRTKRLADGTAGFSTKISDSTVVNGQTVTLTTTAKTSTGTPIVGLLITYSWYVGGTTITTTAYTDSTGRAKSSYKVQSSTTRSTITVTARTSAYSINRASSKTFARVD